MKLLLSFFTCLVTSFLWAQPEEFSGCGYGKVNFKARLSAKASSQTGTYDVIYHRFNLYLNPDSSYISGSVTTYFKALVANDSLLLDASDFLNIDSVIYHGVKIIHKLNDNLLSVHFPAPLLMDKMDSLTIFYHSKPVASGFGSFSVTHHEGVPNLWTLSEPYGSRDWWPGKMSLNDKIDSIDIFTAVPSNYRSVANGVLVSEAQYESLRHMHWKHRYPIASYLIGVTVTNYVDYTEYIKTGADSFPVVNYVFPEEYPDIKQYTEKLSPIIRLYDSLFVAYPFKREKYGQAHFGWHGGMEHQTVSFVADFSEDLMAHELAHQWFGDKITCASWSEIWLNEGFATYLNGLAIEYLRPHLWKQWKQEKIKGIVSLPDGSVYVPDTTDINRIFNSRLSYNKGALVLNMLRWELGDSVFFQACRNYLDDPALAYGFTTTSDLKKHFEAASGKNLDHFFQSWIYGEGYPLYLITWSQEKDKLKLVISQNQSHPSVSFYKMHLPVKIKSLGGDTLLRLDHTVQNQEYEIKIQSRVTSVEFDPDVQLIARSNIWREGEEEVLVLPNPARGLFRLYVRNYPLVNELTLFNELGRQVLVLKNYNSLSEIDISGLKYGIYLIRAKCGDKVFNKKLIVE